jgi:anaerobic magnesium-protoporphyrin IX monomethyl ester cyclase
LKKNPGSAIKLRVNILLINPIINIFAKPGLGYSDQPPVPLGIFYLAAIAETAGHKVTVKNLHESTADKYLRQCRPDIIGITCSTHQYPQAVKIAAAAKKAHPGQVIILGGYFPTYKWETILNETGLFDYLVIGEGEETFKAILGCFPDRDRLESIQGLAYRDSQGKIVFTGLRPLIEDLDSIPFPARHLSGYPIPTVITSRGCPYNCRFCTIKNFYRRKFRQRKVEKVVLGVRS